MRWKALLNAGLTSLVMLGITTVALSERAGAATLPPPDEANAAGKAWGADGDVFGPLGLHVTVGKLARQALPCDPVPGRIYRNMVESSLVPLGDLLTLPDVLLSSGTVVNTGVIHRSPGSLTATEQSRIEGLRLLDGLVRADVATTTAKITYDALGLDKHSEADDHPGGGTGSGFSVVNLQIAGGPVINGEVPPNTVVTLPLGLGTVTLNEQTLIGRTVDAPAGGTERAGIAVEGIHVRFSGLPGLLSGDLTVGHADVKIRQTSTVLSGFAYAARAEVLDPVVETGRIGNLALPCEGTDGVPKSESVAAVDLPGIVSSGTATATVNGDEATLTSMSSERIEGLAVGTLVTADAITTTTTTQPGPGGLVSTSSVEVVNLVVNGLAPINGSVAPNSDIVIPGVGFIRLHARRCQPAGCTGTTESAITATAIHIHFDLGSLGGISVGTDVRVAVAHSDVKL